MRTSPILLGALLFLSFFASPVRTQQLPLYWIAPSYFEEGVPLLKATPVGRVTIGCSVDNYTHSVDWGDGTSGPLVTPGVAHTITYNGMNVTVVDPGTYNLYATTDKTYGPAAPGNPALPAKIKSTLHCLSGTETGYWDVGDWVRVYPHTPLKQITAEPHPIAGGGALVSIKGGTGVAITIISTDRAPPSNAHVSLQWSGPGAGLVVAAASSAEIPYTLFSASPVFNTKTTAATKKVTVTANSGIGSPVQVTFQIVP
jgi:hypothetical protein